MDGLHPVVCEVMPNALENLMWLDLQHNQLTKISSEICEFKKLKALYIHCNYIHQLQEFEKLGHLEHLRSLTVHGNPIDRIEGFRLILIGLLPHVKKLDTVLVTKKEVDNAKYANDFLGLGGKLPSYKGKDLPKPAGSKDGKKSKD